MDVARQKERGIKFVQLRLPKEIVDLIDKDRKKTGIISHLSRHAWIVEAIAEKLKLKKS